MVNFIQLTFLSLFVTFLSSVTALAIERNALFIGNSYTYYNTMPNIVSSLAQSAGNKLVYGAHTSGGATLANHAGNSTLENIIDNGNFHFIGIQAQSQEASLNDAYFNLNVYPAAKTIIDKIRAAGDCAVPSFFMTWGRENGDTANCADWPPSCTYEGMDSVLSSNYTKLANSLNTELLPVAAVWKAVREQYPSYELYAADGSHPSKLGSFLVAATYYTCIFRADPTKCTYVYDDAAKEANILKLARDLIYHEPTRWRIGINDPKPNLESEFIERKNLNFYFDIKANIPENSSFTWFFLNSKSDTMAESRDSVFQPIFSGTTIYKVILKINHCNRVYYDSLSINTSDYFVASVLELEQDLFLSPQPANKVLTINSTIKLEGIEVYNALGEAIEIQLYQNSILVADWPSGWYVLRYRLDDGSHMRRKFLVQH